MATKETISVVIPISERHEHLQELIEGYRDTLVESGHDVETICVLDGEFPAVLRDLRDMQSSHDGLRIIQLSRFFGEATALQAGIDAAEGDVILILPAYPQIDIESLPRLINQLDESDMTVGVRWPRGDSWLNRIQARVFNWIVSAFTDERFRDLGCGVRAARREVFDHVQLYGDQHRFLPILAARAGFRIREVELPQNKRDRRRRIYGVGVYTRRLLDVLTILFLVKFTKKPLRFFGLIGSGFAVIGGLTILYLAIERMLGLTALADRPLLLLAALMLVLGIQLFAIGLIGELIIFTHARQLKEYTIEKIIN